MHTSLTTTDRANPDHWEWQYLDLMRRIRDTGDSRVDRTGVGTRSLFGATIRCDLSAGQMPLITTKRVYWKTATREFLWFLTGSTNIRELCAQGVEIWTDWPLARYRRETGDDITRADFSARIVADADFAARWGDLGPVYGKQWVDWPVYEPAGVASTGEGLFIRRPQGINQVADVVASLRDNPGSRRHIVEGWNVAEIDGMALPPCHKTYQFHVADGRLSGIVFQRSADLVLGVPFNLWGGALFIRLLALHAGLQPGELVWMGGDVHLYANHADLVEQQLARGPDGMPTLDIAPAASIFDHTIADFTVADYAPQAHIAAPVAV